MFSWFNWIFSSESKLEKSEKLRLDARKEGSEMAVAFEAASESYQRGDGQKAKLLSVKARKHEMKMKDLNSSAQKLIFEHYNGDKERGGDQIGE